MRRAGPRLFARGLCKPAAPSGGFFGRLRAARDDLRERWAARDQEYEKVSESALQKSRGVLCAAPPCPLRHSVLTAARLGTRSQWV